MLNTYLRMYDNFIDSSAEKVAGISTNTHDYKQRRLLHSGASLQSNIAAGAKQSATFQMPPSRFPSAAAERILPGISTNYAIGSVLIDENMKFQYEECLKLIADHPNCVVLGVLGKKGVGKSTLVQQLIASGNDHHVHDFKYKKIPTKSSQTVDMYKTSSNLILIDTTPVFSRAVIDRYRRDKSSTAYMTEKEFQETMDGDLRRHQDRWLTTFSVQLTIFLLSTCHVVMTVSDNPDDWQVAELIRLAEQHLYDVREQNEDGNVHTEEGRMDARPTLRNRVEFTPDPKTPKDRTSPTQDTLKDRSEKSSVFYPHWIHILTKQKSDYFSANTIQQYIEKFVHASKRTKLSIRNGFSFAALNKTLFPNVSMSEYNLFVLPMNTKGFDHLRQIEWKEGEPSDDVMVLVDKLYALPHRPNVIVSQLFRTLYTLGHRYTVQKGMVEGNEVNSIEPVKWISATDREWLRNAQHVWDNIRQDLRLQKVMTRKVFEISS